MTNDQKQLANLPPRKQVVVMGMMVISALVTVIGVLWYKLENYEAKDDGNSVAIVADLKEENKDLRQEVKELRAQKTQSDKECNDKLRAKDEQTIKDLRDRLALQQRVNEKVQRTEKNVDAVVKQTETKVTRLTHEIKEKQIEANHEN